MSKQTHYALLYSAGADTHTNRAYLGYIWCYILLHGLLLPAEKGGLRSADVSDSVCLSISCCIDLLYGPILFDQSESRDCDLLTNQDFLFEFHHGMTDQSEFFI